MITIGYSTRKHNPEFITHLKKTCGLKNIQVIEKINNGEKNLSQVYNEILDESLNEVVVLCHDDIEFDTNKWGDKLLKSFEYSDFTILGMAGTKFLNNNCQWWNPRPAMKGIVNHKQGDKKWTSQYSTPNSFDTIDETIIVDGVFMAIYKSDIVHRFDETIDGFHFYDLGFCLPNYLDGVKVGVIYNVRLTHLSIGVTNEQWEINRQKFSERYKEQLPISLLNEVKIVSGFSEKGGSTVALIELTNNLNKNGFDATFYGPHEWHLDKCKSGRIKDLQLSPSDILITHFIELEQRPQVLKVILACHEKWWFKVGEKKQYWDTVVFLHDEHRKYHESYKGDYVIIPNFKPDLKPIQKDHLKHVAGVIGTIEDRKQTHVSIERALNDGCEEVKIFGHISEPQYYETYVKPLLSEKVVHMGYSTSPQELYNSIGKVYHSSKGEVACLVKDECWLTNTEFFGNEETNNEVSTLTNQEIINIWKKTIKNVN